MLLYRFLFLYTNKAPLHSHTTFRRNSRCGSGIFSNTAIRWFSIFEIKISPYYTFSRQESGPSTNCSSILNINSTHSFPTLRRDSGCGSDTFVFLNLNISEGKNNVSFYKILKILVLQEKSRVFCKSILTR